MAGLLETKKQTFDATVNNYFVEPTISYNIEQRLVCIDKPARLTIRVLWVLVSDCV